MALNLAATILHLSFDTLHLSRITADELVVRAQYLNTEADYSQHRYLLEYMVPAYQELLLSAPLVSAESLTLDTLMANTAPSHMQQLLTKRDEHIRYLDKSMDSSMGYQATDVYYRLFQEKTATRNLFSKEAQNLTTFEMDSLFEKAQNWNRHCTAVQRLLLRP